MGWLARLFGGGDPPTTWLDALRGLLESPPRLPVAAPAPPTTEELWRAECDVAGAADAALKAHIDPEAYCLIEWRYRLPDGRWGEMRVHRCGAARLKRELAARGIEGSQAVVGHVLGGQVEMYVLAGPADTGRMASSQRGRGHEQTHIEDQLAAALEAWESTPGGAPWPLMQAAGDQHTHDADHQGEGL